MAVTIGQIYESLAKYEQDNYYLKNAEPQKIGTGWERLGKDVEINEKNYKFLCYGKDPTTGQQLVDQRNGHRLGYNITFSPHKSFSVAAFSSPEMKAQLFEAHHAAVRDTLSYMEKELAQVRMGIDGEKIPVKTQNLLGFVVDHQVNRDGDVQIHTHVILFNMSWNEQTQKWQALHSDSFKSNILEKIYENQLAHYLQEKGFAVEWKASESGKSFYAGIAGVPDAAIQATSQRAAEIKEAVERLRELYPNATEGELKQIAAYETRLDKKEMTLEQIEKQFQSRLEQAGLTKEDILRGIDQARQQWQEQRLESVRMNEYEVVRQAYSVISEQKAVFSSQDLLKASLDISKGDVSLEKLQQAVQDFLKDKDLVKLASDLKIKDGSRTYADSLFTTKENLLAEKNVLKIVEQSKNSVNSLYTKEQVLNELRNFEQKSGFQMTESQRNAVITAMTTKDMVTLYQGYAGVGKTESLKVINELAEKSGYKVLGVSETNVAVGEMKKVGIESFTVTKFLNSSQLKSQVNDRTILVVDECSFMGALNMEKILNIAKEKNARVYLFGDKNQLPPINAGFPFKDLQDKGITTTVEMRAIIRQKDPELKQAVESIIKQDIDKAFEKLKVMEFKENIHQETAKLYVENNGYKDYIISTYTNQDKNILNSEIRNLLKEQGVISKEEHSFTVYTPKNLQGSDKLNIHNYNIGDRLITAKAGAGMKVGAELTITGIDKQNHIIKATAITKQGLKEYQIDIRRYGGHFNVYAAEQRNFSVNDKIIFNANSKQNGIINSEVAYIKEIKQNEIVAQKGKEEIRFNPYQFQYFDHGYASTTYKAQGKTAQGAIYFAPVQEKGARRSYQDFYVAISRAKSSAFVITNDKEKLKEQVKNLAEKESVISAEQKHNLNLDSVYKDLSEQQQREQQKAGQEKEQIDLSKHFKVYDKTEKPNMKWQILPGISYQHGKGLIVSNTKAKDTLVSLLTGKHDTFVKESKVVLGKEKGAKTRTEYTKYPTLLGEKIKGTTVSVNKDKSYVTITKWSGTIDRIKDPDISRLANQKTESFSINLKSFKNDLEQIKKSTQDKDKIKHIEKAQKHLDKLADKADIKHYEKAKSELKKAGIDLDKIREQSKAETISKSHTSEASKTESRTHTPERTMSNEKAAENMRAYFESKSTSVDESKSQSHGISRGR